MTYYMCDCSLNKECKKTACVFNPDAIYHDCALTTNPAFAVCNRNGEPIVVNCNVRQAYDDERVDK